MTQQPLQRSNPTLSHIESGWSTRRTRFGTRHQSRPIVLICAPKRERPSRSTYTLAEQVHELLNALLTVFCFTCTVLFLWLLYRYPALMWHVLLHR
jgi:hypothetical protein